MINLQSLKETELGTVRVGVVMHVYVEVDVLVVGVDVLVVGVDVLVVGVDVVVVVLVAPRALVCAR